MWKFNIVILLNGSSDALKTKWKSTKTSGKNCLFIDKTQHKENDHEMLRIRQTSHFYCFLSHRCSSAKCIYSELTFKDSDTQGPVAIIVRNTPKNLYENRDWGIWCDHCYLPLWSDITTIIDLLDDILSFKKKKKLCTEYCFLLFDRILPFLGSSWRQSYGSWIYIYLSNHTVSNPKLITLQSLGYEWRVLEYDQSWVINDDLISEYHHHNREFDSHPW